MIDNINEYSFIINGDYTLFESLKIGSLNLIQNEDYRVTEGSTKITFTSKGIAKLNTLSNGEYEIIVKYSNNKEVKGKLILNNTSTNNDIENPKTLDKIDLYLSCGIISLVALVMTTLYIKNNY